MADNNHPQLRTLITYVPTLGARKNLIDDAIALVTGGNTTHYWEDSGIIGRLYEKTLGIEGIYAWDLWFVYKPGVRWDGEYPPKPDFTMHQMSQLEREFGDDFIPRLDSKKFAEVVNDTLTEMETSP